MPVVAIWRTLVREEGRPILSEPVRLFSPVEAARRLGVTVKALRIYERHGLIKPARTAAGWRVYDSQNLARVQEIVALKALGLSLAELGAWLTGWDADVWRSLAVQRAVLLEQRERLDRTLARLGQILRRRAAGEILTPDQVLELARDPEPGPHWTDRMRRFYEEHLEPGDQAAVEAEGPWPGLIAELKAFAGGEVPVEAAEVQAFVGRWREAARKASRGDGARQARFAAAWAAAFRDPQTAAALPITPGEYDYLGRAAAAWSRDGPHRTAR